MSKGQRTLKYRFLVPIGLSLFLVLSGVWGLTGMAARTLTEGYISERIEHEIDSLLAELNLDDHDLARLDEGHADVVFRHAFSGLYFQIRLLDEAGGVRQSLSSRSLNGQDLASFDHHGVRHARFKTLGPRGAHLLGVTRTLTIREQRLMISVAEDVDLYEGHFQQFLMLTAGLSLGGFALLLGALLILLNRGLHPFARLKRQLHHLSDGTIRRLDEEVPEEVGPLVRQINWMLETAEQRVKRTRVALDNMAHSLKRPLTLLMQTADDPELASLTEQRRLLMQNSRLMHNVIERTLRRARLVDTSLPGQQFSMADEIPVLIHTVKSLYYKKQLEIELDLRVEMTCTCDREEMLELLGNLLDNACKWGKLNILLTVEKDGEGICCTVEDDGPGCTETLLHTLTRRGTRLDEETEGHGLGLAICQEIAHQLGGRLELGKSSRLGGFLARCHLPGS
ncbi:MAG: HAMP domain-containing histidine kinase [Magnetococcales bacterium]|nr:HAMP domain-containing histidine kinase [Magnetococcales bacterium]